MQPISLIKGEDETLDTFYHGQILVLQKKKGFRFSVDAPLLADFIQTKKGDKLLEIGTGSGVISLLLSIKPLGHVTALEIQSSLVDLARRNVQLNKMTEKIHIVQGDIRDFGTKEKFDVVFSNPPYIKQMSGHLSPSDEKSVAKHELKINIFAIMQKMTKLLKEEGKAYFIFPAKRQEELWQAIAECGMRIRSFRLVYPHKNSEPNFVLVSCDFKTEKEMCHMPLVLYDREGKYSQEAEAIFSGRIHAETS
ncbi:tRNA1(Val) (adenine(37)-N6)-methyltransferase [Acidobacteriota bacterium]